MNSRQRIQAALNGEKMDRIPMLEIGFWPETLERWHKEGLPAGCSPHEYFGLDTIEFFSYDTSLQLPPITVEEDEETKTYIDSDGCKYRAWKNRQGAPFLLESSVKDRDDWDRLKGNLKVDLGRFENSKTAPVSGEIRQDGQLDFYRSYIKKDGFSVLTPYEPCWYFLRLLGEEEALVTIASDPDFAEDIISTCNEFNIRMIQEIYDKGYRFDAMWVFSDLAYKNGMLFSPDFYRKFVLSHHKRFFDFCRKKGMKVIYHSDGNVGELLPLLIEAGIDCIQPMEARAGNDVVEYSRLYGGRISFIGNINADVLASDKESILAEISRKITGVKDTNRYLFHSDHSVPPTVSFENYSYAIQLAKKFGKYE